MIYFVFLICFFTIILLIDIHTFSGDKTFSKNFLSKDYTNFLRAIAILFVVVSHVTGACGTRIGTPLGGIGVAIFLFLSGYGINESYKRNGRNFYWRKKIIRVFIPYSIFILILSTFSGKFDLTRYLLDIFCIRSSYWYVRFLALQYLLFFLSSFLSNRKRMFFLGVSSLIILNNENQLCAEQSFSFMLGILTSNFYTVITSYNSKKLVILGCLCLVIGLSALAIKQVPDIRNTEFAILANVVQLAIKLPIAIFCIILLQFIKYSTILKSRFMHLLGVMSFELYLVHFPFYTKLHPDFMLIVIFLICSFAGAYVFFIFNNKMSKWLKNKICIISH